MEKIIVNIGRGNVFIRYFSYGTWKDLDKRFETTEDAQEFISIHKNDSSIWK